MTKRAIILALVFVSCLNCFAAEPSVNYLNQLPPINGWLIQKNGDYANWRGVKYLGKTLREPINIIIVDPYSNSEEEAIAKLLAQCKKVGYEDELGHSSGYKGEIDSVEYAQIPYGKHLAFANHDFFKTNNHGRILGAAQYENAYIFIAAFSRERPTVLKGVNHLFVSFNMARNDFCDKMNSLSLYKNIGRQNLGNTIDTSDTTTADHDGYAIVLLSSM